MKKVTIAELEKALAIEEKLKGKVALTSVEELFLRSVEVRYRKLGELRPRKIK